MSDLESPLETRLRADIERRAARIEPGPAPATLLRAVRRRRRLRLAVPVASAVAVVLAILLSTGAVPWRPDLRQPSSWRAATQTLPASPLAGRRDVSAVWTGTEVLVWGGLGGSRYFADGAAFNPATGAWRMLPPAPLSPRSRQQAVWTGTEMIVWGGVALLSKPSDIPADGAAYDPRTDTWRRIALGPVEGRTEAQALMVGGKVVVVGGSNIGGVSAAKEVLLYDPATNTWEQRGAGMRVVDAVDFGGRLVLAGVDDRGRAEVEVLGGAPVELPFPYRVDRLSLTLDGDLLVVAVSDESGRHHVLLTARLGADGTPGPWSTRKIPQTVQPAVMVSTLFRGLSTQLAADTVLLAASPEVAIVRPSTGRVLLKGSLAQPGPSCGISGALVWTGTALFRWGGQTCSPNGGFSSSGVLWTPAG